MDVMIEMKDLNEGGTTLDDDYYDEELVGGMEMRSGKKKNSFLPVHHHKAQASVENGDVDDYQPERPAGSGIVWLLRRQLETRPNTRWMVIVLGTLVLVTTVYVVGNVYMSNDSVNALVQPFDRESGFVENGAENEKEQEANDNQQDHSNIAHWGGQQNPFANNDNQPKHHQHQSFASQGDGDHGGAGKLGHDGHIGHKRPGIFGHQQEGQQGNSAASSTNGSNSDVSVISNDNTSSNGASPQQPVANDIDEKDVYCEDLSRYQSWYDATVTKESGPQFRVVKQYDHDRRAFTQGLTYARGQLFESTGRYGRSTVRILDPHTVDVLKTVPMDEHLFGEGMTYYKDTLVQITWKSQKGFVYNMTTLETIDQFQFSSTNNEGWGITWDRCKDELIVTDGSQYLHFWDPTTKVEKRKIPVFRINGEKALQLNEIEFWRGRVLANVWYEDVLLVINPETGVVEKEYDFSTLWPKSERSANGADVFNGISVTLDSDILYVTGKLWDRLFTVELLPSLQ